MLGIALCVFGASPVLKVQDFTSDHSWMSSTDWLMWSALVDLCILITNKPVGHHNNRKPLRFLWHSAPSFSNTTQTLETCSLRISPQNKQIEMNSSHENRWECTIQWKRSKWNDHGTGRINMRCFLSTTWHRETESIQFRFTSADMIWSCCAVVKQTSVKSYSPLALWKFISDWHISLSLSHIRGAGNVLPLVISGSY